MDNVCCCCALWDFSTPSVVIIHVFIVRMRFNLNGGLYISSNIYRLYTSTMLANSSNIIMCMWTMCLFFWFSVFTNLIWSISNFIYKFAQYFYRVQPTNHSGFEKKLRPKWIEQFACYQLFRLCSRCIACDFKFLIVNSELGLVRKYMLKLDQFKMLQW